MEGGGSEGRGGGGRVGVVHFGLEKQRCRRLLDKTMLLLVAKVTVTVCCLCVWRVWIVVRT